ncbi:hypothetical protein AGR5A_Lc70162 [Agrobacterium genomosp. 5 str. CFBP 6626]|nr:hypothetical protein AGR5A_Lc70162 [Agrobacterium genomosp. 5 str. CFBP 6626]
MFGLAHEEAPAFETGRPMRVGQAVRISRATTAANRTAIIARMRLDAHQPPGPALLLTGAPERTGRVRLRRELSLVMAPPQKT